MSDTAKTILYIVLALLLLVPFVVIYLMHAETDLLTGFDKFYFFATAIVVLVLWICMQVDEAPTGLIIGVWIAAGVLALMSGIGENDATLMRGTAVVLLLFSCIVASLHVAFLYNFPTVWAAIYALLPLISFFVIPRFFELTWKIVDLKAPLGIIAICSVPAALLIDKVLDIFSGVIPSGGGSSKRTVSFSSVENAMRAFNRSSNTCVGGVKQHGNRIIVQLSGINGYSASGWEAAKVKTHLESWLGVGDLDRTNVSIYY